MGFILIKRVKKWDKFLFRNVVYKKIVNKKEGLIDVLIANYKVSTLHRH